METITGYIINENNEKKEVLKHWDALINQWFLCIERYISVTNGGDAPYWYNERANVGVLSAAAWLCGRVALEEFQHEKLDVLANDETDKTTQKQWLGRGDLWICDEQSEEFIEAKYALLDLYSEKMTDLAMSCLDAALKDAHKTKGKRNIRSIGVAFLPVYASEKTVGNPKKLKNIKNLGERIKKTIDNIQKNCPADLIAWCFPERVRNHVGKTHKNYYPGIILIAKVI